MMIARKLSHNYKRLLATVALILIVVEIFLALNLVESEQKKGQVAYDLPPDVQKYQGYNSRKLIENVQQEVAGGGVDQPQITGAQQMKGVIRSRDRGQRAAVKWDVVHSDNQEKAMLSPNPAKTKIINPISTAVQPFHPLVGTEAKSLVSTKSTTSMVYTHPAPSQNGLVQNITAAKTKVPTNMQTKYHSMTEDNILVSNISKRGNISKPIKPILEETEINHTRNVPFGKNLTNANTRGKSNLSGLQSVNNPKVSFVDPHKPFEDLTAHSLNRDCNSLARTFGTDFFCLHDVVNLTELYFSKTKYGWCYVKGAELIDKRRECYCITGWHGQHCSMPDMVEKSNYPYKYGVAVTNTPKRVIYAFPFNFEFELLEARLEEFGDLVDVYVILESNYTASGKGKPLYLLNNLQKGYLRDYQHKILHVTMDFFPAAAYKDGWVVDEMFRHFLGNQALARIENLRPDDVFIIADADELPVWETVFFLKFHYGYPEPIGFYLKHNVFAFYWLGPDLTSHVFGACSVAMLQKVFGGNPYHLRSATHYMHNNPSLVDKYRYKGGGRIHEWSFGSKTAPVGWHCSWCFEAQRIQHKLLSAHLSDLPRWGNNPEKTKIPYINDLITNGGWFDEKSKLVAVNEKFDRWFAPSYFLGENRTGQYLLKPP